MKAKLILTTALFTLLTAGFANVDVNNYHANDVVNPFTNEATTETSNQIVKAVLYEGEIISSIELPEIEITGKRNTEHFTKAALIDGEIVSVIELEEIVIRPNS